MLENKSLVEQIFNGFVEILHFSDRLSFKMVSAYVLHLNTSVKIAMAVINYKEIFHKWLKQLANDYFSNKLNST